MTNRTNPNQGDEDMSDTIDRMTTGYIGCALWCGLYWPEDLEGDVGPWEDAGFDTDDVSAEALAEARELCSEFYADNADDLATYYPGSEPEQWGHDLYLTRNGHGAGFWDRYYGADDSIRSAGRRLSDASEPYGEADFYVDDAGKLVWS